MAPDELQMAIKIILANDKSLVKFKHTHLQSIQEEQTDDLTTEVTEVQMAEKLTSETFSESTPHEVAFQCEEGCINYGCDLLKMCRHERSKRLREERIRRMDVMRREAKEKNKQREARLRSLIKQAQLDKDNGKLIYR